MISGFGRIPNPIWPQDRPTTGGEGDAKKGHLWRAANFEPTEHLDYDQIEFKIRSKTVKDSAKPKGSVLTILWKRKMNFLLC